MTNTKEYNFHHSVTAIEDLRSLVASDFKPIADLALFHVQEMKQNYEYEWGSNNESYGAVRGILEGQIKNLFEFYAGTNRQISRTNFSHEKESFGLISWNRLLSTLDLVLRSLSFFKFHGTMNVSMKDNRLTVSGKLRKFKCEGEIRVRLYSLIRSFLKKETIFTYEMVENGPEASLSFTYDFSHRSNEVLNFSTAHGSLAFSSSIRGYEVKNLQKLQNLEHQTLVVDENYHLSILDQIPENYFQTFASNEANFTVFHFSFLFKPVSLIIPMRGEVQFLREKSGTYVDIFSIINN